MLNVNRHIAIMLPSYHPKLNPIENVWEYLKNCVATNNVNFKLVDVKCLMEEKCASIGRSEWECLKAKRVEDYIREELIMSQEII